MIQYKVERHQVKNSEVFEVWIDGVFMAAIYPNDEGNGFRLMSRHLKEDPIEYPTLPGNFRTWEFKFSQAAARPAVLLGQNPLGRWVIVHGDSPGLAWSGSQWVTHDHGIANGPAQICNFTTDEEAEAYVKEHFDAFYPPPIGS